MQHSLLHRRWGMLVVGFFFIFSSVLITLPIRGVVAEGEEEASTTCSETAIPASGIPLEVPLGITGGDVAHDLPDYLGKFYQFVIASIAILAAVKIIIAGFNWVFAAGSQEKIGMAKEALASAIWGLMIALLSYTILSILNPKLIEIPPICPPAPAFIEIPTIYGQACQSSSDCAVSGYYCVTATYGSGSQSLYVCSDGRKGASCITIGGSHEDALCQTGLDCVSGKCTKQ